MELDNLIKEIEGIIFHADELIKKEPYIYESEKKEINLLAFNRIKKLMKKRKIIDVKSNKYH